MKIRIKEGVEWDTEAGAAQSEAATAWLREEVYGRLAMNSRETDRVIPVTDRWGRPTEWVIEGSGWLVRVTREYVEADRPTWSRRRDVVTVEATDPQEGGES